jgi:TM2 domain-containing membrane protein YozV
MRGTVLGFDAAAGTGAIAGDDGRRYAFAGAEWRGGPLMPVAGTAVDFEASDAAALGVYPIPGVTVPAGGAPFAPGAAYPKSHVAAGLLALLLGSWGIHKFYLGYNTEGAILLGGTIVSFVLCIIVIGFFGLLAIGLVCFVEAILYLTKSEAEFHQAYVVERRPWF